MDRLSVIYHIDLSEKEKATVVEKFFRECQEKKTTKFYLNKNRLLEIMREEFE